MSTFLTIAAKYELPIILDTFTWGASPAWFNELKTPSDIQSTVYEDSTTLNRRCIEEVQQGKTSPQAFVSALVGPMFDAYLPPEEEHDVQSAEEYHSSSAQKIVAMHDQRDLQGPDYIYFESFNSSTEAAGAVRALIARQKPHHQPLVIVSFTTAKDGSLPSGEHLRDAISHTEQLCKNTSQIIGYMHACMHPAYFGQLIESESNLHGGQLAQWLHRVVGIRGNASKMSHEELDAQDKLDCGDVDGWAASMWNVRKLLPACRILGGCYGTDEEHCEALAKLVVSHWDTSIEIHAIDQ